MSGSPDYSLMDGSDVENQRPHFNNNSSSLNSANCENEDEIIHNKIIVSTARFYLFCLLCKTIPRPRVNQMPFFVCPNGNHVVCISCMRLLKCENYCRGCKTNIPGWQNPKENFYLYTMYKEISSFSNFQCLRHCGKNLRGSEVLSHDNSCTYGRKMLCPHDNLEIVLYNHDVNDHTAHLISNFPLEYIPRIWSIVFDWKYASHFGSDHIPIQILYLESEENYLRKKNLSTLNTYNPIAACVKFNVARRVFKSPEGIYTVCEIQIQWMESANFEASCLPHFKVNETKQNLGTIATNTFYLKPFYQPEPLSQTPGILGEISVAQPRIRPSTAKIKIPSNPFAKTPTLAGATSAEAAGAGETFNKEAKPLEAVYVQFFDNLNIATRQPNSSIAFPCKRCGSLDSMHTHFDIFLEGTY